MIGNPDTYSPRPEATRKRHKDAAEIVGGLCLMVMGLAIGVVCWGSYILAGMAASAWGGEWVDAEIVAIDYESGQCTYSWGEGAASGQAECPPKPDRGQTISMYVVDLEDSDPLIFKAESDAWGGVRLGALVLLGALAIGTGAWLLGGWTDDYLNASPSADDPTA